MRNPEEIRSEIEGVRESARDVINKLEQEFVLASYGISVGSTLKHKNEPMSFVVDEIAPGGDFGFGMKLKGTLTTEKHRVYERDLDEWEVVK